MTLVEMLVAMALTLLIMAAVVGVFANVSESIGNRRSAIEMSTELRNVRNLLQRDLAGATCPAIPQQRTDSSHGYIELIEGPRTDWDPSLWLRNGDGDDELDFIDAGAGDALDLGTSTLPTSNLARLPGNTDLVTADFPGAVTDGGGLGDWDDTLMLTVRNEAEPFTGLVPAGGVAAATAGFFSWGSQTIESTLAEVAWFAVENPVESSDATTGAFGEPGYRTVYRRVLLVAPWLDYGFVVAGPNGNQTTGPGIVRVLGNGVDRNEVTTALAALVAFQDRYDLSVRIEWDSLLGTGGRWKIVANSLADLTKRENRFEHHGYFAGAGNFVALTADDRRFPFTAISSGGVYGGDVSLGFQEDPEASVADAGGGADVGNTAGQAILYEVTNGGGYVNDNDSNASVNENPNDDIYYGRPFVWVASDLATNLPGAAHATPRAIVDENGTVVAVANGLAPLGGPRRGEDVVMTNALAFDLRVYDAQAPVLAEVQASTNTNFPGELVGPGDAGWGRIVARDGISAGGSLPTVVSRGAYVDLGYFRVHESFYRNSDDLQALNSWPALATAADQALAVQFVDESVFAGSQANRSRLRPNNAALFDPYRAYDTWSFHYENNGINEDGDQGTPPSTLVAGDPLIDEGVNGFDDDVNFNTGDAVLGPDDPGERETSPPYDARLRGVQVTLRAYEPDSRQFREVKVSQTYVPK